jgi:toxin ParE1/3/4
MAKVVWTEPALQDLDEIAEYIALDKLSAAKKTGQKKYLLRQISWKTFPG